MKQLPAVPTVQSPVVQQALRASTSNYDEWSRNQNFARAQRQGRVQYVVHINTPQHHIHEHVHYDGGKLPKDWGNDW